jgi:hypothetical protein
MDTEAGLARESEAAKGPESVDITQNHKSAKSELHSFGGATTEGDVFIQLSTCKI